MAKLQDLFTQPHKAQGGGGMGFLGKNKSEFKARTAALVVEFPKVKAGGAEGALKAGADGLLFHWDGKDQTTLNAVKAEIESARASNESTVVGLNVTGGWDKLDRESLVQIKEQGVQYIILPFNAPARLLALETKDLEKVIVVPMRQEEFYSLYIRNLVAFDGITAVLLDFAFKAKVGTLSIEEILDYRAVREAVRYAAFLRVTGDLNEADAYTINTLGVQALVLTASEEEETTHQQIKDLRALQEKTHHDDKEKDSPTLSGAKSKLPL